MRKQFFRRIDSVLPRWLALLPYTCALLALRAFIGIGLNSWVWNRNSTRSGAFVFGVSDLDVTVVSRGSLSFEFLRSVLSGMKNIFIFLGETNLYQLSHLPIVLPRMNAFELKRDPVLKEFHPLIKTEDNVEKFVFTQRMLFADVFTLASEPVLRQSKWKNHFDLIGYNSQGKFIDLDFVIDALKNLCDQNSRICSALDVWRSLVLKKDFDHFNNNLGEGFKLLAPHCHLWFHLSDEKRFLEGLSEFERGLIKAQINWEFWGLYCQRYLLNRNQILEHLKRLQTAHACTVSEAERLKLEQEITLVF